MTLLSIIIVWSLYQFTIAHHRFEQVRWFETLLVKLDPQIQKVFASDNWRFVFLIFLPLFVFWIFIHLLVYSTGHIGHLVLGSIVLWYCWLYQESISIIPGTTRDQTRFIFHDALSQYFSVTFWFVIFGPVGALLYDFTRRSQKSSYKVYADMLRQILDWPAARMLGLGYTLAGHFSPAFSYWALHLFSDTKQNHLFLEEAGLCALNGNSTDLPSDEKEPEHAKALVKRAEIMLLIALAIFTLGSLLY